MHAIHPQEEIHIFLCSAPGIRRARQFYIAAPSPASAAMEFVYASNIRNALAVKVRDEKEDVTYNFRHVTKSRCKLGEVRFYYV